MFILIQTLILLIQTNFNLSAFFPFPFAIIFFPRTRRTIIHKSGKIIKFKRERRTNERTNERSHNDDDDEVDAENEMRMKKKKK